MTLRSISKTLAVAVCFGSWAALTAPAMAQNADTSALMDRIERLERDIRTLNIQIARGGGATGVTSTATGSDAGSGDPAYARFSVRLSELETTLRSLTGRIEELNFNVNQVTQRVDKMSTDVDYRLRQLEQGGGAAPASGMQPSTGMPNSAGSAIGQQDNTAPGVSGIPDGSRVLGTLPQGGATGATTPAPAAETKSEADALLAQLTGDAPATPATPVTAPQPAATTQTASAPATGTPRDQYMQAFSLLRQGKYDEASTALKQFIADHKDDKLASNARYWLGETHYVKGAYVDAAETFLEGYQTDPQGPKAPDALLKLGMSLSSLDKKNEACAAFQKLRSDYPNASAGLKTTLQREWEKNGCV